MLSLAMIDPGYVEFGKEVTLVWGEPNGGTKKPTVEPHVQTEIKAIVSPVPYSEVARKHYADSWRQTGVGVNTLVDAYAFRDRKTGGAAAARRPPLFSFRQQPCSLSGACALRSGRDEATDPGPCAGAAFSGRRAIRGRRGAGRPPGDLCRRDAGGFMGAADRGKRGVPVRSRNVLRRLDRQLEQAARVRDRRGDVPRHRRPAGRADRAARARARRLGRTDVRRCPARSRARRVPFPACRTRPCRSDLRGDRA